MGQQLKPGVAKTLKIAKWAAIALAIVGVVYFVKTSSKKVTESQQIGQITMAEGFDNQKATTSNKLALPDFDNPIGSGTPIKFEIMAWNSQFPLMYANGGVRSSKGSLFAQAGIDCEIIRQDDCNQSIKDFVENAEQLANGKTQTPVIVCYMGDGVPGMSSGLNAIKKLGGGHRPVAFYTMGRSNGEDCFWGPADWKSHPEHAGDQVRSFPEAQEFAAKVSAKVYNEKDANYWLKYFRGSDESDKQGNRVRLGGS